MQKTPKLEDKIMFLGYKIIRSVKAEMGGDACGPSLLQLRLMMAMIDREMSMSQIAEEFQMRMPTATLLVVRLHLAGYIERVRDAKDQRKVMIKLTNSGKDTIAKAMETKTKKIKEYLGAFSETEKKSFYQLLEKLFQQINLQK